MTTALEEHARGQGLRTFFRKIRHKIEKDPARPRLLRTELGVGYGLTNDVVT
jgi:DNA-binding response OmpR family regulator